MCNVNIMIINIHIEVWFTALFCIIDCVQPPLTECRTSWSVNARSEGSAVLS